MWDEGASAPLGAALSGLALGYRAGLTARDQLYGLGLLRTGRLPCPVVSIGNLTLGGSGKTPMVELAVRTLAALGASPAVVSRGYQRATRGVQVVADRDSVRLSPRAAGDEPFLLAERLPRVPVVVGENRYEAGRRAVEELQATVVVLDDGFQNRTIDKDLEVLVVNGRAPWGNGRLFPRGTLREPLGALRRADLVVVTNPASSAEVQAVEATLRRHRGRAPVVSASYQPVEARRADGAERLAPAALAGRRLLAFAGLGFPRGFAETLTGTGATVAELVPFPDHHWYAAADLDALATRARAIGAEGLITTEKDGVRLRDIELPGFPVWVLAVKMSLETNREVWVRILKGIGLASLAET
ncbi:MAG TPA: tetraacyldisaccharide 4'-kinase [Candidatus Limnocylindrales bacterium]|nr:tetraacyldisaccharide 4'-kinase [Candidatus Limnocylindrales bacterium]